MSKTHNPGFTKKKILNAGDLVLIVAGTPVVAKSKLFKPDPTGKSSVGWYASGKVTMLIDGVPCTVQVGATLTVIGSKDMPEGE